MVCLSRICVLFLVTTVVCCDPGRGRQQEFRRISTESLAASLGKPGWLIVDVRNSNAFNGWKVGEESRGGHIRSATNLSLDWFQDSRAGFADLVLSKKLAQNRVILYGSTERDAVQMADWLVTDAKIPHEQLFIYDSGFAAWSNRQLPVDRLARYEKLVPATWVHDLIRSGDSPKFRIVEVTWRQRDQYERGHLPGAVCLDTEEIESLPLWNIVSSEKITQTLLSLGITTDTLVVVYGRDQTAAARAAVVMMYAGVADVRLLNGGYSAWLNAGYPAEVTPVKITAASEFGARIPKHPEWIVGVEEAKAVLADPQGRLVSTRSWEEFIGDTSGYAYIRRKGRIAGAVWGRLDIAEGMEDFRNPDGTLRDYHEIESQWLARGLERKQRICFYCGTGWRASEAFMAAYLLGFEQISVFDGGWYEWSSNPLNPVEQGTPQGTETEK